MPKKISEELRARAARLVNDHRGKNQNMTAVCAAAAKQVGVGKESVRRWVVQPQVVSGKRAGTTSEETAEVKKLKAENRRLRDDNSILKAAATAFFAAGSSASTTISTTSARAANWSSGRRRPRRSSSTRQAGVGIGLGFALSLSWVLS